MAPQMATMRKLAGFGVQGEAGNILQLLNYRLDQYMVRGFVSLAGVGIYATAVSLTEGVFILANAVALVLISVTGIAIFLAMTLVSHLALRHWHESAMKERK